MGLGHYLLKIGQNLQARREKFLEVKRKNLEQGDVRYAYSWDDVETALRSILKKYKDGELSREKALSKIDKIVDYINRYSLMFELRGLGVNPGQRAWELGRKYKKLIETSPQKKPEVHHYMPKIVREAKKHKAKKGSRKSKHKKSPSRKRKRK